MSGETEQPPAEDIPEWEARAPLAEEFRTLETITDLLEMLPESSQLEIISMLALNLPQRPETLLEATMRLDKDLHEEQEDQQG